MGFRIEAGTLEDRAPFEKDATNRIDGRLPGIFSNVVQDLYYSAIEIPSQQIGTVLREVVASGCSHLHQTSVCGLDVVYPKQCRQIEAKP